MTIALPQEMRFTISKIRESPLSGLFCGNWRFAAAVAIESRGILV